MVDSAVDVNDERIIRVFILDDYELVRRGLTDLLGSADDMEVVEGANAGEALRRNPAARPDVALLDARLPDGSGIEVCRDIRSSYPEISCVILTSFDDEEALFAVVMAGAGGTLGRRDKGHVGIGRIVSGSVSHYCLSHAQCPVVAVPAAPDHNADKDHDHAATDTPAYS